MRNSHAFLAFLALFAMSGYALGQLAPPAQDGSLSDTTAPPAPDEDGVYRQGPGIVAPVLVHPAAVTNSSELIGKCAPRTVTISAVINSDGGIGVRNTQQASDPACELAVARAVMRSTFQPGTWNNKPVPVLVCLAVSFPADANGALPSIQPCPESLSTATFAGQPLYRPGGAVQGPVVTVHQNAQFSDEALRAKYQGICLIALIVDALGNPQNVRVSRALGMGLDEKALEAVRGYRFKPATFNGRPVPVTITIEIDFRLYQRPSY